MNEMRNGHALQHICSPVTAVSSEWTIACKTVLPSSSSYPWYIITSPRSLCRIQVQPAMQVSHFLRSIGSASKGRSHLSHWRLFSTKFTSAGVEADASKALKTVIEPVTGTKLHSLGCIEVQYDE